MPLTGWYGLVAIGDGWRPVTPPEGRQTLLLSVARDAGATHVGYWDRDWQHVTPIDDIEPPRG
jgi:hypothetical protein